MFNLDLLRRTDPVCDPLWTAATRLAGNATFRVPPRTRLRLEGLENFPDGPSVVSPNHTHKFDFFPIRLALLDHDRFLITWIKARDYKGLGMRTFFSHTGNIPLASRGYIIASDFAQEMGRKPADDEYRALRAHVDEGAEIDPALRARLEKQSRSVLGTAADPSTSGYRTAIRDAYGELMELTVELARRGRDAGHHQHIYPQGSTSAQLTPGRIGAVQAAIALDVPIVPVGISGCREVFVGSSPVSRGGEVVIRIGQPMVVPPDTVPASFRPFRPDDEFEYAEPLQQVTDELMARINVLVEPRYRWADDGVSDAKRGVARFYA